VKVPDAAELAKCLAIAAGHLSLAQHRQRQGFTFPELSQPDSTRIAAALCAWHGRSREPGHSVPEEPAPNPAPAGGRRRAKSV
jgi:hypothetical protein